MKASGLVVYDAPLLALRWSIVMQRKSLHGGACQDALPIDDPLVEDLAALADPVIARDVGAASAPRRLTTHGHAMGALDVV